MVSEKLSQLEIAGIVITVVVDKLGHCRCEVPSAQFRTIKSLGQECVVMAVKFFNVTGCHLNTRFQCQLTGKVFQAAML